MKLAVGIAAMLLTAAASPALAQSTGEPRPLAEDPDGAPPENDDTLTIGAGVGYVPSYDGSDNYVVIPVGAVRGKISGHNFFTRGTSLFFDLIPEPPGEDLDLSLGVVGNVRLDRTNRIKDVRVRALGELDEAYEVGGFVGVSKTGVITSDFDTLGVRVDYLRDVSDTHDSFLIQPSIEYGTPLSTTVYVGLGVSASIVGDGYARTYFSVDNAGFLASTLPVYDADGGVKDISVNALANFSLSGDLREGLGLFVLGSYSRLLGDFKRSPIVRIAGDADQYYAAVGIGYTF